MAEVVHLHHVRVLDCGDGFGAADQRQGQALLVAGSQHGGLDLVAGLVSPKGPLDVEPIVHSPARQLDDHVAVAFARRARRPPAYLSERLRNRFSSAAASAI